MALKSRLTIAACIALVPAWVTLASAQDLPKNSTGENDVFAGERVQVRTPAQQVADRLKLDAKTQVPVVDRIFADAMKEAAPIGVQMLQLRQQLVNLELGKKPDEMKAVVDAYAAAAAKMAGVEARAFASVYATLKPNQQSNAPQAFALMAGMFQPPPPRAGGRGQRGGGQQR